jgi:hypothetical protein
MKTYGYFCEDEAIKAFIDKALEIIGPQTRCKGFTKRENPMGMPSGNNADSIKKNFPIAVKLAFANIENDTKIDLFFVSYDYDDTGRESFDQHIKQQKNKIGIKQRGKTIFCIPVKCIEYWLWYIKHADDKPAPSHNSIETDSNVTRRQIKEDIYGSRIPAVATQLIKSKEILEKLSIEHLEKQSPSFKNFADQIREFCQRG